jgi:S1-C subfamily serine protease/peroxiredoxin
MPRLTYEMLVVAVLINGSLVVGQSQDEPFGGQESAPPAAAGRTAWTVTTPEGERKIEARLRGLSKGVASFETDDGRQISVPLEQLAGEDRKAALIERVGSGVAVVSTKDVFGEPAGFGSGFVIQAGGLILTNYHVIAGAGSVEVTFRDHAKTFAAEVLAVDRLHDVAYLRVAALPDDVHVVELTMTMPSLGATVWTIGHPSGLVNTVGWGNLNAIRTTDKLPPQLRQALQTPAETQWLQTNAVLAQGSSGGPLLNELGQAVGINTFVIGPQFGFAIHIHHARAAYLEAKRDSPLTLPVAPGENEDALAWPSRRIAPLLKAFSDDYRELQTAAQGLPPDQVQARLATLRKKYREQFLRLAEESPDGWPGVQSLAYAAQFCDGEDSQQTLDQICRLALQHHRDHPHLAAISKSVGDQPASSAREFCRQVREVSPHESVRLGATLQLSGSLLRWLQSPDSIEIEGLQQAREELDQIIKSLEEGAESDPQGNAAKQGPAIANALRNSLATIQTGLPAPEIEGVDIQGQTFKLSDYRGKVVLLDFFADWCPHCRRMYPGERAMVQQLKDRPFALLGVHSENQKVLDELVKQNKVTWRCWADGPQGPIVQRWSVEAFPTMVLIDHQGRIRWRSSGVPDEAALKGLIEQLLSEAEA